MDSTDTNTNTNDTDTQDSQVKEENKYEVIDFSVFSDKITNKEMENRIDEAIKNFNELEENSDEIDSKKEDISNAYHDNVDELNDIENNLNETKTKIENNQKQYEERNSKIDEEIAKNNEELIAKYQEVVKAQAELSALDPSDPTYIAKKDSLDELNKEAKTLDTEKNNLAKEKQELPTVKENIAKDMKEYDELAKMYNSRVDGLNEINNKIPEGVEIKDVNVNKVELFVPEKNDIAQEQIFQGGAPVQQYQEEDKNVTGEEENKDEQEKKEQTQEEQEETPEEKLHRVFDNIDEATPEEIKEALDGFDKIDFSNEDLECADRLNDRYHDLTGDYHEGFVNGTESKLKEKLDDIKNKRQEYKEQEKTGEELDKLNEDEAKYQFYYDRYKQIIEEKEREKEKEKEKEKEHTEEHGNDEQEVEENKDEKLPEEDEPIQGDDSEPLPEEDEPIQGNDNTKSVENDTMPKKKKFFENAKAVREQYDKMEEAGLNNYERFQEQESKENRAEENEIIQPNNEETAIAKVSIWTKLRGRFKNFFSKNKNRSDMPSAQEGRNSTDIEREAFVAEIAGHVYTQEEILENQLKREGDKKKNKVKNREINEYQQDEIK